MTEERFKIGILGLLGNLYIKDGYLKYISSYGRTFMVKLSDIDTVSIDTVSMTKGKLKIIGKGSELASVELLTHHAVGCQQWIMSKIN